MNSKNPASAPLQKVAGKAKLATAARAAPKAPAKAAAKAVPKKVARSVAPESAQGPQDLESMIAGMLKTPKAP